MTSGPVQTLKMSFSKPVIGQLLPISCSDGLLTKTMSNKELDMNSDWDEDWNDSSNSLDVIQV